ncbi:DUF2730 family protein [Pseudomonas aeruginosa]|uniref:DUF2730 family protein n=1 Tax=Pseudomonas aeruginosa TaxID=287 RepID=UPI00053EF6F2|nr:DUF2730 family protein [Pseudomonas aeruginosa]KSK16701.1 hypothetical protein APA28_12850 [Pseudomonas aeruginosa]MCU8928553.1 DUF2730 domain-containing protein [Pseudomonas aeruginosa]MDQ2471832.1 DUF2730 family protein [Pseudomonas aeruginosa]MDS9596545.1 DUF2730 family protein [Pseudomonas aeruginosa]MDT8228831.1 DUF2730 family protein [Pseudomonas aeruginosa]
MDIDMLIRAGQFLFTMAVGLFSIASARRASSKAEAEQLAGRLGQQDARILTLEQQILHLPDGHQLAELAGDMKAIKAELSGLAKALDPLTRSVDRINDYLLSEKRP